MLTVEERLNLIEERLDKLEGKDREVRESLAATLREAANSLEDDEEEVRARRFTDPGEEDE